MIDLSPRLISCLIQLVKKQHDILHSQDLLNNELKSKYDQCCFLVEERGVAWSSPLAEQERSSSKPTWDDNEDFCISDIIDIQIPKLHMQGNISQLLTIYPQPFFFSPFHFILHFIHLSVLSLILSIIWEMRFPFDLSAS